MKKLIIAALALVMALPTFAQGYGMHHNKYELIHSYAYGEGNHQIYYGLRLGLGFTNVNSDNMELDGGSMQTGINLGGIIGFQLSPDYPVYLESGLMYMEKGGKGTNYSKESSSIDKKKFTYSLNYLELPVLVKYIYDIDDEMSIQPFAGGYFAVGVSGKMKNYADRESKSSFSSDYFKRFDGGLRIGCGFQYQVLYGEVAYEYGLANIARDEFESAHNGDFMINVGVNF